MTARVVVLVTGIVVGAVLVALAVPVAAGVYPVAQVVAFRGVLLLGASVAAIVLVALPATRRPLLPLMLAFTVGALAQSAVLLWRSVPHSSGTAAGPDIIVVLSFNTADVAPARALADLALARHADVVVLPETSRSTGATVAALMAQAGRPMQALTATGTMTWVAGTVLLVDDRVGTYPTSTPLPTRFGSLRADPQDPATSPVLVAAHPISPGNRSWMPAWRDETALIVHTCTSTPGAIVAGDLNSTLDHPALRDLGSCVDAAREVGQAAHGTWPSSAPSLLAAPIDHVLVDGRAWRVVDFQVLPATGGSDHRPIVATLVPRGG